MKKLLIAGVFLLPFLVSAQSVPTATTLKVVSNVTGSTGSLVSASIAGFPTNTNVSYWKLNIACTAGVTVTDYNGSNVCGANNRYDRSNIYNPTVDYAMITSYGLKNSASSQQEIDLTLKAYDANDATTGVDTNVIYLGANVLTLAPTISSINTAWGGTPRQGDMVDVLGSNFNSTAAISIDGIAYLYSNLAKYVHPGLINFTIPSNLSVGSHGLEIVTTSGGVFVSNKVTFQVAPASVPTTPIAPFPIGPLTITTPSALPNAKVGQSYFATINTSGINPNNGYNWSANSNFPLIGFSFGPSYGNSINITGIPHLAPQQTPQTFTFNVSVNSGSETVTKSFSLTVDPATTSTVTPTVTPVTPTVNPTTIPTTYTNDAQKMEIIKQLQTLLASLIQQLIVLLQQQSASGSH